MRRIRIHLLGAPGSGKSYLAARLSAWLAVPALGLDEFYWDHSADRYGIRRSDVERDAELKTVVDLDSWIIEGVYHQWLAASFQRADVIIVLTTPVWLRDWRIGLRFAKRKLRLAPGKRESIADLAALLKWNHSYDSNNLRSALKMIAGMGRTPVECRSYRDARTAVEELVAS